VDDGTISQALEAVGARLKRLRTQRGLSLTVLSEMTGISKSTLSRLETGQRRASLELLLPLARAYRVPLDDLVGAPEVGDPRIRLRPRRVHGRTVIPLTPRPGGVQAWKIIIPAAQTAPELRVHDGYEWLYVLSGRLRFILGNQDLILEPGEAAEFDTRLPHWFGSAGGQQAEILSLFGQQGEGVHVRAAPNRRSGHGGWSSASPDAASMAEDEHR
jgi:transcriptional regulator with XRE-family HTH domain